MRRSASASASRLAGGLDLDAAVAAQAGAGRDELADDDVLLEAGEVVDLALDGGVGEHLGGLLEGGRRQEALGGQRRLGDAEDDLLGLGGLAAVGDHALVLGRNGWRSTSWPGRKMVSPAVTMRTLRIMRRTMSSMCLSLISTPCER